jgi:hypothetical protein
MASEHLLFLRGAWNFLIGWLRHRLMLSWRFVSNIFLDVFHFTKYICYGYTLLKIL